MVITYKHKSTTPKVGLLWDGTDLTGGLQKHLAVCPSDQIILDNLARVFYFSQSKIFAPIENMDNIFLDIDENTGKRFNQNEIYTDLNEGSADHKGIWFDKNADSIWKNLGSQGIELTSQLFIYVVLGQGEKLQKARARVVNIAIPLWLSSMNGGNACQELVDGWPANINPNLRDSYQPTINLFPQEITTNPATGDSARLGPIPRIVCAIRMVLKENIF